MQCYVIYNAVTDCLLQHVGSLSVTVVAVQRVWMTVTNIKRRHLVHLTPTVAVCSLSSIKLTTEKKNRSRKPVPQRRNAKTRIQLNGNGATIMLGNFALFNAVKKPISAIEVMQCRWLAPYWCLPAPLWSFSVEWQRQQVFDVLNLFMSQNLYDEVWSSNNTEYYYIIVRKQFLYIIPE